MTASGAIIASLDAHPADRLRKMQHPPYPMREYRVSVQEYKRRHAGVRFSEYRINCEHVSRALDRLATMCYCGLVLNGHYLLHLCLLELVHYFSKFQEACKTIAKALTENCVPLPRDGIWTANRVMRNSQHSQHSIHGG